MKTTTLFSCLLLFFAFNSYAQVDFPKGSLLLGGSIGYNNAKSGNASLYESKGYSFSVLPAIGLAIKENLFAGVSVGYIHSNTKILNSSSGATDSGTLNNYFYGLFLRKYKPLKYGFSIFLQGDLAGYSIKDVSRGNTQPTETIQKSKGVELSLTPGISYNISSRFQLESGFNKIVSVTYGEIKTIRSDSPINKTRLFSATANLNNFGSQLFFGFRFLLQKKQKSTT